MGLYSCNLFLVSDSSSFRSLLSKYLWILNPVSSTLAPDHGIFNRIPTHRQPVWSCMDLPQDQSTVRIPTTCMMSTRQQLLLHLVHRSSCGCSLACAKQGQPLMNSIFLLFAHLDDILVARSSHNEYLSHLRQVFDRLPEHALITWPEKCAVGSSSISFVGHKVNSAGIKPLPVNFQAVQDFPKPSTSYSFFLLVFT